MPLVSVLLPVYNTAETLPFALEGLLQQSLTDQEIVIVDDGSTDGTPLVIEKYKDPRIRVFRTTHKGLNEALNFGLNHCKGTFIARMDGDDVAARDRLLLQSQYLEEHPEIGVVSCRVNYRCTNEWGEGYQTHVSWVNGILSPEDHRLNRFVDAPVAHPSVMFRASLVAEYGAYTREEIPEDFELWLRWMHEGVKFAKIREPLLDWYDQPKRLSRTHPRYSQERFYEVKARYFRKWYERYGGNRDIWIWGLGRTVNRRVRHLHLPIAGFIDVKAHDELNIIHFQEVRNLSNSIILSYVSDRTGRRQIHQYLSGAGKKEGEDFWLMA